MAPRDGPRAPDIMFRAAARMPLSMDTMLVGAARNPVAVTGVSDWVAGGVFQDN